MEARIDEIVDREYIFWKNQLWTWFLWKTCEFFWFLAISSFVLTILVNFIFYYEKDSLLSLIYLLISFCKLQQFLQITSFRCRISLILENFAIFYVSYSTKDCFEFSFQFFHRKCIYDLAKRNHATHVGFSYLWIIYSAA